ncbi:MAG: hypothetical protein HY801_16135 [Candidatus Lindowbacteria bacterium]|nr:hypothetical protein [Candidatus Lindowbacteria bacterium]
MNNSRSFGLEARFPILVSVIILSLMFSCVAWAEGSALGGEQLFKEKCAICHSLDRAFNRFDPTENWEKVVVRQRSKAPFWIGSDDAKAITEYLENRDKRISAGRPDLLPEAMAARQSLIVVEPAARMNENVSVPRFNTASAAYAANELLLSGVQFFEKLTQLGLPTDKDLVGITSEEAYWYSRYILSAVNMESGIGLHILRSRRVVLEAEEEGIPAKEFYEKFLARVRERTGQAASPPGLYPIFAEFASGEPELTELPDFNDYGTLRWNPQKFEKIITPAALGQALYNQTLWAEYLFGSKHGENLLGNDAVEGYIGAVLVDEAISKMHFLRAEAAYDGRALGPVNPFAYEGKTLYYPHQILVELSYPEGEPPVPTQYKVTDPASQLFDQASLLLGTSEFYRFSDPKVEDNWNAVFGSPAEGALFPPEAHNMALGLTGVVLKNMIALHFDPVRQTFTSSWANGETGKTISSLDAGVALVALANVYNAFHDEEEIRQGARNMLERQAQFLSEYMQLPDGGFVDTYNIETSAQSKVPRKLASQAMAIRGLLAAYQVTENSSYLESALTALNFMNENLWSAAASMYRSAEGAELSKYSPVDVAATLGALREVVIVRQDNDALKKFKLFFLTAMKRNGMQLAELEPTGEKMGSVRDVMTPDSDNDGVRKPQFAGGKFGIAPVVAGQIEVSTP